MPECCVDASFALKLVLLETERTRVKARWAQWRAEGITLIAPCPSLLNGCRAIPAQD